MQSTFALLIALATLLSTASADFLLSNTSVCMGTFIVQNCFHGVKVLSEIKDDKPDYSCSNLIHAEDNNYITSNGTVGVYGTDVSSSNGICDSGALDFKKVYDGNDTTYSVFKHEGNEHVADCVYDNSTQAHCNQWVGMIYFQSTFKCTGSICS